MALIKSKAPAKTSSAPKFRYQARSAEEVKARAARSIGSRDSYLLQEVEMFSPKAGDNSLRILPPTWEGARHYGLDLHLHYDIGPDESAYLCLDKMSGEKCPLCEERAAASASGEEELANALRPKQRVLVWVIDRKEEAKGPLCWSMPAGLDKDIVNCAIDKSTGEILAVDDPSDNGYDISFKREGEGIKTKYTGVQVARRQSPLSDDPALADKWLEYISNHTLESILQLRDYDTLKAAYAGTVVHKDDEPRRGKKEEAPAPTKVPPRGTGKVPARAPAPKEPEPEAELPSWEEVHAASEQDVTELIEASLLTKEAEEAEGIDSLEKLQDWVCTRLGIEAPAPAPTAPAGGSWRDRLKKAQGK